MYIRTTLFVAALTLSACGSATTAAKTTQVDHDIRKTGKITPTKGVFTHAYMYSYSDVLDEMELLLTTAEVEPCKGKPDSGLVLPELPSTKGTKALDRSNAGVLAYRSGLPVAGWFSVYATGKVQIDTLGDDQVTGSVDLTLAGSKDGPVDDAGSTRGSFVAKRVICD